MNNTSDQSLKSAYETFVRLVMSDGPIDQLDDLATIDAMGYGTTIDEVIHDLPELKNLARLQREQTANENFHYNSTPVFRKVMNHGTTAVFVDEMQLNFLFEGNPMSFQIRLSVIMELVVDKWKAVHFHASKPEYDSGGSDPWHKEEWKQKNEELQRMVDKKTADLAGKNRELEIEAALERVRTVAMSMQKPDDLLDVCRIISGQLELLNVNNIRNVQVAIIDEPKKTYSNYQFFAAYANAVFEETLYEKNPASKAMVAEMRKSTNSFFIGSIKDDELQKFRDWRKKYDQFPDPVLDNLTEVFYYFYSIGEGGLGLTTYKAIDDKDLGVFKRFHLVFKLAYRRFMDIQQAEAQARESQLELSLERIRSQVTAMQESAELLDIVVTMRTEFVALNHEAHYFWYMRWLPEKYEKAMTSGDGTRIGMVMSLPRHIHGDVKLVADWEKSGAPTLVFAMDEETAVNYVHKMITLGDFKQVDPQAPTLDDIRKLGGLTFIMARTRHGEIGFSLPGEVHNPSKESVITLARFASVFDLAYKRFEDLKTAEKDIIEIKAAKQKAEEALFELKATQTQLIHAEKMASLGELTAGIAHEIQNPLNFVNNFAEVSLELMDEMKQESEVRSQKSEVSGQQAANEILDDIKQNLDKILQHGKRADAIVKGMLQHSRTSSGVKEPTDINELADEYLRLSYHGLRAKDKTFQADFKTDFDPNLPKINVIPQDIGRVLLNLINNAFYAVGSRGKKETAKTQYDASQPDCTPTVTVSTKNLGEKIEIRVKDNGNGIPEEIKDKIFQPFFTTKPTGEGTGLGLSMSYDIVKAHGGELSVRTPLEKVESKEGNGSEFIIQLPLT